MMIRIESDPLLKKLQRQDVVAYYYDSKSVTWVKVAQQFHISERTAQAWRVEIKHILGAVL
ncbi:hypothetical protein [Leuconostoc gelidum]|uniref:hypothetical protein n=1 Tax=Leuconostoc gelidum TaxID=1244 RepID=UPI001CC40DDE|nr:hypothetical protein [Leuconostoc gelidum]